jgi:hypothetical protein
VFVVKICLSFALIHADRATYTVTSSPDILNAAGATFSLCGPYRFLPQFVVGGRSDVPWASGTHHKEINNAVRALIGCVVAAPEAAYGSEQGIFIAFVRLPCSYHSISLLSVYRS